MDLGFIESKTYDEIAVGDTAGTEHILTSEDAMAFASISGFHSVLNYDELVKRAGGIPPTGPNMWCASLISGLFSMNTPGPGCTLTNVCLSFKNRIHVGDRILVQVRVTAKDDTTKRVNFDCDAVSGDGTPIFSGTAQVIAPEKKVRYSTLPVPQLIVNNPYRHYLGLIARATSKPPSAPPLPGLAMRFRWAAPSRPSRTTSSSRFWWARKRKSAPLPRRSSSTSTDSRSSTSRQAAWPH